MVEMQEVNHFSNSWRFKSIMKVISKLGLQHKVNDNGEIIILARNFDFDPIKKIEL